MRIRQEFFIIFAVAMFNKKIAPFRRSCFSLVLRLCRQIKKLRIKKKPGKRGPKAARPIFNCVILFLLFCCP